jgi:hypothetical protein
MSSIGGITPTPLSLPAPLTPAAGKDVVTTSTPSTASASTLQTTTQITVSSTAYAPPGPTDTLNGSGTNSGQNPAYPLVTKKHRTETTSTTQNKAQTPPQNSIAASEQNPAHPAVTKKQPIKLGPPAGLYSALSDANTGSARGLNVNLQV